MEEFGINNSYNGPLNPLHCSRRMKYKHSLGFVERPNTFKEPYMKRTKQQSWACASIVATIRHLKVVNCHITFQNCAKSIIVVVQSLVATLKQCRKPNSTKQHRRHLPFPLQYGIFTLLYPLYMAPTISNCLKYLQSLCKGPDSSL